MPLNEADTCRVYVTPKLSESGWEQHPHSITEQKTDHGPSEFSIPDALQVAPINAHGNVMEIAGLFGGAPSMKQAVDRLQSLLYSAQIPG
ncbi:MAG: hypothetical protein C1943_03885 [Halochromatium sp.]|nr:hypothetical protein [Halochromatium sp.]